MLIDKSTDKQAKAIVRGLGTFIACLALIPLSAGAFGHTEPTSAQLNRAEAGERAHTNDLHLRLSFSIPSESLNVALADLSAQSRVHVVTSGVPSDVLSPGVKGDVSTLDALTALLHGTGMSFRQADAETLVVAPVRTGQLRPTQFQLAGDAFADQPTTAAAPAAGAPGPGPSTLQEVTVSASAISIAGYQAPTPVTALGIQQLQAAAQPDIGNVLRQMPQIQGQNQNVTAGDVSDNLGGIDFLDLRSLGLNRTLVLFDGQRVVAESNQGGVDMSLIPSSLVARTDVVTGGASATWGSDAVAGVVNLIINKNFNGALLNVEYTNNSQGKVPQERADITVGTLFAGGRGHVEAAGSFWNSPNYYPETALPGWNSPDLVANPLCTGYKTGIYTANCPAGQYVWKKAFGVYLAKATQGGLITSGLNNQAIPLNNIAFGPGGQPYTFVCGNNSVGIDCNGGGSFGTYTQANTYPYATPLKNYTAFLLGSFNITDSLRASLQLNYARTSVESQLNNSRLLGNIPIYSGNPYIPASVQAQLTALNLPGFKMGNLLNDPPTTSIGGSLNTIGDDVVWNYRTLQRGVFTLDGNLGKWEWNAYYMHGQNTLVETAWSMVQNPNLFEAENAVLVTPAMNAAVPSLPVGSITCAANVPLNLLPGGANGLVASTALSPGATPGCQPVNLMGVGMYSQAAKNYILGPSQQPGRIPGYNGDTDHNNIMESVVSGSIQGELPFGFSAGPVAAAAGMLYRSESIVGINCGINCDDVYFHGGNFVNDYGNYNIKEANAEVNVPVLDAQRLSFDAAARWSNYSTSGSVETYKFGVVSQVTNWLRFRGLYSVDIRAPNLYELFELPQSEGGSLIDPRTGQSNNGFTLNVGNPKLTPETAETRSFGFVFTPVQGMDVSIDWYYIAISALISEGFSTAQTESQCLAGVAQFCELLYFGHYPTNYCVGPTFTSCPLSQPLNDIVDTKLNSNSEDMSGMDFNGNYRTPFMNGTLSVNTALNYTFMNRYTTLGTTNDSLNSLGGNESLYNASPGHITATTTKFHGNVGVTYSEGGWVGTVQTRMIGHAWLVSQWLNTNFLSNKDNELPFIAYLDLRLSYEWGNGLQLYGAIDDALNRYPPWSFSAQDSTLLNGAARTDIYDVLGRTIRVGLRYRVGGN